MHMAADISAAANRHGGIGSSGEPCRPTSWRGGGFGGTVDHTGPLDGDTCAITGEWAGDTVVIAVVMSARIAIGGAGAP